MGCNCIHNFIVPTLSQLGHGIVANAKIILQIDEAPLELQKQRWNICRACEHSTKNPKYLTHECLGLTMFSQCKLCSCVIRRKAMLKSEKCPDKRWSESFMCKILWVLC